MAVKIQNLSSGGVNSEVFLRELLEQYGKETQPKVGVVRRLLAPFTGIGSAIDAYYDARFGQGNANIANFLKEYGKNVVGGFKTLATGKEDEQLQGLSALLEKTNSGFRRSPIGSSTAGRIGLDIVGGLLTDPTTYVSFGLASLADDAVKAGLSAVKKISGLNLTDDTVKALSKTLTGSTIDDATRVLARDFGQEAADKFYVAATRKMGSGARSGALKVFGKTVTENPLVVKGAKAFVSPVMAGGEQVAKVARKVAPDEVFRIQSLFDEVGAAISAGKSDLADELLNLQRLKRSLPKRAYSELMDSGVISAYKKLSKEEKKNLGKLIQQSSRYGTFGPVALPGGAMGLTGPGALEGPIIKAPEGASKNVRDFIDKYFDLQRSYSGKLEGRGFPTISEWEQGYIHQTYRGYSKDFIEKYLKKDIGEEATERILSNKGVQRELNKLGMVKRETLEKLLTRENKGILSDYDMGDLARMLKGEGSVLERQFPSYEVAERAGLYANLPGEKTPWLETIAEQTVRQKQQIMAKDFAEKLKTLTDDAGRPLFRDKPEGVFSHPVNLMGTEAGVEGTRVYTDKVTKAIAENVLGSFKDVKTSSRTLELFDNAMNTFKGLVTAKGPNLLRYQTRNAIDDLTRMLVGGVDFKQLPENMKLAYELIKFDNLVVEKGLKAAKEEVAGNQQFLKILKEAGIETTGDGIEDMWRVAVDSGVITPYAQTAVESGLPTSLHRALGEPSTATEWLNEGYRAGGIFENRENLFRTTTFLDSLRKSKSVSNATSEVKRVLYNYAEMTRFESDVMKRLIPFYSFTKQNLLFWLGEFKDHPEYIGRFNSLLEALRTGSISLAPEEWEAMPQWMKEGLGFPTGFDEKTGKMTGLAEIGSSLEQVGEILDPTGRGLISNMNPFLSYFLERATGQNFYQGEPILNINEAQRYSNYPEVLKKLIGYREYEKAPAGREPYMVQTMNPEVKHLLENFPILSPYNVGMQRLSNLFSGDKEAALGELERLSVPYREYERNVGNAEEIIKRQEEEALYELLRKKGFAELYQRYYIPAELKDILIQ